MQKDIIEIILSTEQKYDRLFMDKGKIYSFLNPVSFLDALKKPAVFMGFDGLFADGSLMVAAIFLLYGKKVSRRSFDMTSLAPLLFMNAEENGKSVYIVASKQEQVEIAAQILKGRYPNVRFVGLRNGYFNDESELNEEAHKIVSVNPDFLIVGMGAVKQEEFLLRVKKAGFQGIGFTCGGFIHQTSNNEINYYPQWIDKCNLRFLYRMYREPHTRMRYLKAGIFFPWRFMLERFRNA